MTNSQPRPFNAATNKWAYAQAFTSASVGHHTRRSGRALLARHTAVRRQRTESTPRALVRAISRPVTR